MFFPSFHKKYNYIFGPLLECLSLYMMYSSENELGYDWIASSEQALQILLTMGRNGLMPPEEESQECL
jgi:hypothetical protein